MRAVSYVDRLSFEFKGNISPKALVLGDVNNNGEIELVIGNHHGDLAVFRKDQSQPWLEAHDLGMITVVIVGDILNTQNNCIVCISADGQCAIFDVTEEQSDKKNLQPRHNQRFPANIKTALLHDIDNDGQIELIVGLTDLVLRTYRWAEISQETGVTGKLVGLHKLELADQIGGISLNPTEDGPPSILVAQSGGTYINFQCLVEEENDTETSVAKLTTPVHHTLARSRIRNPHISSDILGGVGMTRNGKRKNTLMAVATLDGTLMLVDGDEILWSFQVDHQLFAVSRLDILGDGEEDVMACAWDGLTYIVNQQKQSVRFQFEEHVSAFACGPYNVDDHDPVNVLAYATFTDSVHVYYNIKLPSFRLPTFFETMQNDSQASEFIPKFPVEADNKRQLKNLFSACMYGFPSNLLNKDDILSEHLMKPMEFF